MSEGKEQQRKPTSATAKEKADKSQQQRHQANVRVRKARNILRKQHSVPDK